MRQEENFEVKKALEELDFKDDKEIEQLALEASQNHQETEAEKEKEAEIIMRNFQEEFPDAIKSFEGALVKERTKIEGEYGEDFAGEKMDKKDQEKLLISMQRQLEEVQRRFDEYRKAKEFLENKK